MRNREPIARIRARAGRALRACTVAALVGVSGSPSEAAEISPADVLKIVPVVRQQEEILLKCGGDAGDHLQMALEERKLAYRAWTRARNSKARAGGGAALLSYFSHVPDTVPAWFRTGWSPALSQENALPDIEHSKNDSDMGLQSWLRFMYLHRDDPQLPREAAARIRAALLGYRYWIDDPPRNDTERGQQFWTENHQIMYAAGELLAGQLYPNERFRDGRTGAEHRAAAAKRADEWLSWRLFHGFNEWNSPVYYEYTFTALLNLADFAEDARLANRASMALDLLVFDLARFTQKGSFGATSGRVYDEHKHAGWRQSIGDLVQMLFGTRGPWPGGKPTDLWVNTSQPGPHALATARRYCVPSVLLAIGRDTPARFIDRSRVSVNLGEPHGVGYSTDEDAMFWWGKSAYFVGPMVDKSNEMIRKYQLGDIFDADWYNELRNLSVPLLGRGNELLSVFFEGMALTRANLYAYRDPDVMLTSVQRFRPGQVGPQLNAWQVTFDPEVTVFGTYPAALSSGNGPNWWTGNAVNPFVVQRDSAAIAVYAPHPLGAQAAAFGHRTHLWFPIGETDLSGTGFLPVGAPIDTGRFKFDEWVFNPPHSSNDLAGSMWMFGRKGDGYVGIYSAQPCKLMTSGTWRNKEVSCDGLRNAFVIQVGNAATFGSFRQFIDACVRARINVAKGLREPMRPGVDVQVSFDSPDPVARQANGGYRLEVHYDKGQARFNGQVLAVDEFPRFDNPYARAPFGAVDYTIALGDLSLRHHQQQGVREGSGLGRRPYVGRFDMRQYLRNHLYVVRPDGQLVEHIDAITVDHRTKEERARDAAKPIGPRAAWQMVIEHGPQAIGSAPPAPESDRWRLEGAAIEPLPPVSVKPVVTAGPRTLHRLSPPAPVGSGWRQFRSVVPAGGAAVYAVKDNGQLLWYRYDGIKDGAPNWTGPVPVKIGFEGYAQVFGGGEGVVYGIEADGTLHWHRHRESRNARAPAAWDPMRVVGSGWHQFTHVFGGGGGVIYAIRPDGVLMWYRHDGYLDGSTRWAPPRPIGTGWGRFKRVVAAGSGAIYALTSDGRLLYYVHTGWANGTPTWYAPAEVGRLREAADVFVALPDPVIVN